jgi:hypothetical protein
MIQGAGAGAKISLLGEKNVAVPRSVATVILEVLFDVLLTGAVAGIYLSKDVLKLGMSYQFGATIACFALLIAGSPIILRRYPWWSEFVMVLHRSIGSYRGIFNLLITMGIWFTAGVSLSILLSGFGVEFGVLNVLAGTAVLMMRVISIATVVIILIGLRYSPRKKGNGKGMSA